MPMFVTSSHDQIVAFLRRYEIHASAPIYANGRNFNDFQQYRNVSKTLTN